MMDMEKHRMPPNSMAFGRMVPSKLMIRNERTEREMRVVHDETTARQVEEE